MPSNDNSTKEVPEALVKPSILDLPTEIIILIILLASKQDFHAPHNPRQTILCISQLCRDLRDITLDLPAAWAQSMDLGGHSKLLTKVIIPRCRNVHFDTLVLPPVTTNLLKSDSMKKIARERSAVPTIDILDEERVPCSEFNRKLCRILPSLIGQTRNIVLRVNPRDWKDIGNFFRQTLSSLEGLTVMRGQGGDEVEPRDEDQCTSVTINQFLSDVSSPWNLRSLNLRKCYFDLESTAFSRLEELILFDLPVCVAICPSAMLHILQNMPHLKRLELDKVTFTEAYLEEGDEEVFWYGIEDGPVVKLPKLQKFIFDGPVTHCASLISKLQIPPTCIINFTCTSITSIPSPDDPCRQIVAYFSSRKAGCKAITLGKSITVEITDGGLVFGTTQPTLESRRDILMERQKDTEAPTSYFCLCLLWDEELTHIDPLELLGFVADSFHDSFAEVTDLRLNYDLPQPTDWALHRMDLMKFLYPFKQLQHVDVANNSTFGFLLPYLHHPICTHRDLPSWYQPSPKASWSLDPLSSLRSFYFLDVDFMTLFFSGPSTQTVHSLLIRYMKSRCSRYGKTSGMTGRGLIRKINRIYLHNCTGLSNLAWGQLGFYGASVETLDPAGSSTGN